MGDHRWYMQHATALSSYLPCEHEQSVVARAAPIESRRERVRIDEDKGIDADCDDKYGHTDGGLRQVI